MALATGTDNGIEVKKADRRDLGESITQGDAAFGGMGYGILNLFGGVGLFGGGLGLDTELLPPLLPYWSQARDNLLSTTMDFEDFWADAVAITITKGSATAFEVKGSVDLQARRGQELFNDHTNGGQGWGSFVAQHLQDYCLTDKGAFIEIDRQDNSKPGSKVIGLYHLDSHRCFLTGDPDKPVIYWSLDGTYHYMTWWQVYHISDLPNPRNNYFKIGRCAASRAYRTIRRMVAAGVFDYDEMTGARPNKLVALQGTTQTAIDGWVQSDRNNRVNQPATIHGNVALTAMMAKDKIDKLEIKIREKPEGWDDEAQLEHAAIKYAAALGLDKADLKPFTGRMSGTATQSQVMHNKQTGKGLALWRNSFEWFMSNFVLPTQASFHWNDFDLGQKKEKAELFNSIMTGVRAATGPDAVILTGPQGLQVLVDEEVLGKEFLPNGEDLTPGVELADDEKPLFPADQQPQTSQASQAVAQVAQQVKDVVRQKIALG